MKIAGSVLEILGEDNLIKKLSKSGIDYIHLDVMDNDFVNNYSFPNKKIYKDIDIPIDIHLMVNKIDKYIEYYKDINPSFITFHYEIGNILNNIKLIKENNIKVGLAINPETNIEEIIPFLDKIDLILIMSVHPGYGGQEFIDNSIKKVNMLKEYRNKFKLNYLIEIDGGINDLNIISLDVDIAVIGSYITKSSDYKNQIRKLVIK